MQPLFSILHTSARPNKWREIYDAWISSAVNPEQVEYVLCVDERWGFEGPYDGSGKPHTLNRWYEERFNHGEPRNLVTWNRQRRCYVDGVNTAAKASTGRILIVNADDQYPCEGWDEALIGVMERAVGTSYGTDPARWPDGVFATAGGGLWPDEFVLHVSTGTPDEHARRIMVMPILSRARYERLGYVFYPEYESMFADNEFCEHAQQDGVIIDARHLLFPHKHYSFDGYGWLSEEMQREGTDEAYQAQNRPEAFQLGDALLRTRRAEHFDPAKRHDIQKQEPTNAKQRCIALCLSGEHFHAEYLDNLLTLFQYLWWKDFIVLRGRAYTTNVYATREEVRTAVMKADTPPADLFLWFDDDNPAPTPEQFELLLKDLDEHPEADGVTGWCWIYNKDHGTFQPSCGWWAPDGLHWRAFDVTEFPFEERPRPVECTGFPCFLMRRSALEKAGNRPFLPILDERLTHGLMGEDLAFCRRAEDGGAKFLVEPRVRVRHLKTCDVTPELPARMDREPVVAVMMRVKNEARWIKRCIESVIPLAGENVFVMDDESTDGTLEIARSLGVNVYSDPFAGEPLDEPRDKEWLLEKVKAACAPDWILCIDGDEELEPHGAEKILRVLRTDPKCDVFALGFLFLWDRLDQVRIDGRYASIVRETLFRASSPAAFRSYYEGKNSGDPKCHVGLHCGNAPNGRGGELVVKSMPVFLLHYGYLFREDRIRKYNWYRSIDPDNEYEDNYRHMVIGDLPELPAETETKYAGPLKTIKLIASCVPTFDVMPEPLKDESEEVTA